MTTSILLLLAGVLLAWIGATLFVNGSVALAKWARWPAAVIGVTVAAFGTSTPELMVSIQSAVDGVPQISLGDVLGSNVVNLALVLAIVLAISGMKAEDSGIRRDWTAMLAVPFILGAILCDGWFSRLDAAILMILFAGWLMLVIRHARRHADQLTDEIEEVAAVPKTPGRMIWAQIAGGLLLLIGAAQLVVIGGKGVAVALGWSQFVVGAVVVAVATGTPELATTIVARIRGHHDVGLGNILGSNIFNALFVAAAAAFIRPYAVKFSEIFPSLCFGVVTVLLVCPSRSGSLGRSRGLALLAIYTGYVVFTLRS